MQNLTSEQTEEVDARKKAFMLAYGLLRDEYQIDSIAYPALVPNQEGLFVVAVQYALMDLKYAPQPSPFIPSK